MSATTSSGTVGDICSARVAAFTSSSNMLRVSSSLPLASIRHNYAPWIRPPKRPSHRMPGAPPLFMGPPDTPAPRQVLGKNHGTCRQLPPSRVASRAGWQLTGTSTADEPDIIAMARCVSRGGWGGRKKWGAQNGTLLLPLTRKNPAVGNEPLSVNGPGSLDEFVACRIRHSPSAAPFDSGSRHSDWPLRRLP